MSETAILAGGCFWGMQDLIRKRPGVISTRVGYTGGDVPNATYRNHGTHAEAIEVVFDPQQVSYRELLELFFQIHDPTTKNRQGNDIGMSYRSAIYYTSDEQRRVAQDTIADVEASGIWPGKVVTEVEPAGPFWEAEPEHQDYLERYPNGYTCHYPRPNWVLPAAPGARQLLVGRARPRPVWARTRAACSPPAGQTPPCAWTFRPTRPTTCARGRAAPRTWTSTPARAVERRRSSGRAVTLGRHGQSL